TRSAVTDGAIARWNVPSRRGSASVSSDPARATASSCRPSYPPTPGSSLVTSASAASLWSRSPLPPLPPPSLPSVSTAPHAPQLAAGAGTSVLQSGHRITGQDYGAQARLRAGQRDAAHWRGAFRGCGTVEDAG